MHLIVKTAAVAALGVFAWRAWQRRRAATAAAGGVRDAGDITPAHGDPRVPAVEEEFSYEPRVAAHSSPGFGG